jgi:hypothetical protein
MTASGRSCALHLAPSRQGRGMCFCCAFLFPLPSRERVRVRGDFAFSPPLGCLGRGLNWGMLRRACLSTWLTGRFFRADRASLRAAQFKTPTEVYPVGAAQRATPEGGAVPCVARCDPVGGDEALRSGVRHRLAVGRIPQAGPCSLLAVPFLWLFSLGKQRK